MDNQEKIMRSIASSLQQISFSMVKVTNQLVEISKLLDEEQETATDGD